MAKNYYENQTTRAYYLLNAYNQNDKKYCRGEGNLTPKWIVDNIFSKTCVYCGEDDWTKLGCNRKNNDLPHTIDNVEPCCHKCNCRLNPIDNLSIEVYQYAPDGKLVAVWKNARIAADELGFDRRNICSCCNGKRKTANGYIWSYFPL